MKCQFCNDEGERSTVMIGGSSSTCMGVSPGHYDEDGEFVAGFDPNWHTTEYFCSRGHRFKVMRRQGTADVLTLISTLTTSSSAVKTPVPSAVSDEEGR